MVSSNAHRLVVAVGRRGLWCHMIKVSESIKMLRYKGTLQTENSIWTRKLNFLFYHKCNTSGQWTCVLGSKKNMVFVVMTSRKTTRACVIVFTVRYNSVPQNGSFISIFLFFVYHLWEIIPHEAFLYLLAQTLSRMYGYLKPHSPSLFLENKAFQAPKLNCQFFCISNVLVCLL